MPPPSTYRGRVAPSPTGLLHIGHARTFWIAAQRAREKQGTLIFRNEDLDAQRCRPEFVATMYEDLRWLGITWHEGPDIGGPFGPYSQSDRREFYLKAWRELRDGGFIYPCSCSRKDVAESAAAPHESQGGEFQVGEFQENDEPVYSRKCRFRADAANFGAPAGVNWWFRVPDGEAVPFADLNLGPQSFTAGRDFGDFLVWRRDDVPAYQLAVVVDDAAMQITEVVRGADLLKSTSRQILLYRALGLVTPDFYHCELVRDEAGVRLAKRHDALSIRRLKEQGMAPDQLI
ncbi:MAG: glutamate--tRNA ligase family protein [Terriglobales bacterium]